MSVYFRKIFEKCALNKEMKQCAYMKQILILSLEPLFKQGYLNVAFIFEILFR